ncbi:hypothetical protein CTM70_16180 [Photobacterium phosphoreum]|uniref:protease inhibitor I42 family protein n=1 Tax=Photobacterium phosphoreum TaxID=659 RepID=UPI000D17314F|nr:protease inhibitor I42 family protein [Photobacterium phosphoreum]PSW39329.1 hypothetical protein CTM70_16180 [Photobacterium phosphoreum]
MKIMKKMVLTTVLGCMSMSVFAAQSSETASQLHCDAGFTSIVTGDLSKAPQQTCLPTDGKLPVNIKLGQTFQLNLPANPSTGSSWALRSMPNSLMLLDMSYHNSAQCKKGMVGCGGLRSYTFEAVANGVGELKLNYGRAWEKDGWESKNIAISVKP